MDFETKLKIVVAVCIQEDFCQVMTDKQKRERGLILHCGYKAAERIVNGVKSSVGSISDIAGTIRDAEDPNLVWIFVNDLHRKGRDDFHLSLFGDHCLEGTDGARLVGNLEEISQMENSYIIPTDELRIINNDQFAQTVNTLIETYGVEDPREMRWMWMGGHTDVLIRQPVEILYCSMGYPNPYHEGGEPWLFNAGNVAFVEDLCFSGKPTEHMSAVNSMEKIVIPNLKSPQQIFEYLQLDI